MCKGGKLHIRANIQKRLLFWLVSLSLASRYVVTMLCCAVCDTNSQLNCARAIENDTEINAMRYCAQRSCSVRRIYNFTLIFNKQSNWIYIYYIKTIHTIISSGKKCDWFRIRVCTAYCTFRNIQIVHNVHTLCPKFSGICCTNKNHVEFFSKKKYWSVKIKQFHTFKW